jgi:hypothetical protein
MREADRRISTKGSMIRYLIVRCACGTEREVNINDIRHGKSKSCGCLQKEAARKSQTTHGKSGSPEYVAWSNMIARCENPNTDRFASYGGRGIKVCRRWRISFPAFLEDIGFRPTPDHSIERKNANNNYTPGNCHWATDEQQLANKRSMTKGLVGKSFGRLKVTGTAPGRYRFAVLCKCRKRTTVYGYDLLSGKTLSCGCLRSDKNRDRKR